MKIIIPKKHGDFKEIESKRDVFPKKEWKVTQSLCPGWKAGSGASDDEWKGKKMIGIDPYGTVGLFLVPLGKFKREVPDLINYRFVSSVSKDGIRNLAPFSYTNLCGHDPPIFTIGFSLAGGKFKDTMQNIVDTGECVINIISEWFAEAANYTSIDAPADVDEWTLSGLTPVESTKVKPPRVGESAFVVEGKLVNHQIFKSLVTGKDSSGLVVVQGIQMHVREDVVNEELNLIDLALLKPISRLGGIMYGRVSEGFELQRPVFEEERKKEDDIKRAIFQIEHGELRKQHEARRGYVG
ncbi:hypothetical protein NEOLI_002178 [Neolecta irregularis DAH-3]|uniref:Flavin reductase like domain-containing protein n=1 Tax=Neolecta irregularis (strain DAH-3) TaxID=1198029 RepID=A0A1U7LSE6_NEOID|nr:hypothetical protein NEOLI_002178 [Neolecta irregularis DAH-3]|eukprot:OLL25549.1 hypothetical protein NEOLI_002178 [Neolecta irregularis DAH-3]